MSSGSSALLLLACALPFLTSVIGRRPALGGPLWCVDLGAQWLAVRFLSLAVDTTPKVDEVDPVGCSLGVIEQASSYLRLTDDAAKSCAVESVDDFGVEQSLGDEDAHTL